MGKALKVETIFVKVNKNQDSQYLLRINTVMNIAKKSLIYGYEMNREG
ncbi:hypothetical protein SynRS9902_01215 [Synechococcus sp. RS9902]|nr:hypothetical protein SynRS9902_01215 [Synechococcus sp. RS9902]